MKVSDRLELCVERILRGPRGSRKGPPKLDFVYTGEAPKS